MATVNKDFKVKNGLIVEGTNATVNNYDILTKKQADQDYIIGLIGGSATSEATADTVVLRDENADFAANDITVNELSIKEMGRIYEDDGDLIISNTDESDVIIEADDIRLNATDDIRLTSGTGSDIVLSADSGVIRFEAPDIYAGENLQYVDSEKVATRGYVDTAVETATDTLTDHINATEAHGATGAVVGTTNEQTLTNKTISYTDNTLTVQVANVSDLTASAAELNTLDGITASTAELNLLHGVTATTAEINLLDGVTSTTAELNILDGVTADYTELNILDGATLSTAELNLLDGVTATTTELNYVDGVTSGIQGQLDDKAPLESPSLTGTPLAPTATPGTNNTQIATTAYADAAVAAIVDGAPDLLNTLNELAAAINDDENFASTLTTLAGEKVAKAGDTMTGLLVLSADPSAELGAATKQYVDAAESDAVTSANSYTNDRETAITTAYESYADQAEVDAKAYADDLINDASSSSAEVWSAYKTGTEIGLAQQAAIDHADALDTDDIEEGSANLYFTNQRAIDAVGETIEDAIDLLDTDDIEEGATNLYFTDSRAKASAGDLLAGATTDNVDITYINGILSISAENGVADSDTDDLTEGTSNLYFTNTRAVDALEAVVPNFTEVDINSLATQVAATVSVATASANNVAYAFAKADYRSAEFLVKTAYSTHTEISKVLLTLDTSDNIAITEYGIVGTNGASMTISADIDGANVRLLVTTANNTSTVTVVGTLLA